MKEFILKLVKEETGAETVEVGVTMSVVAVGSVTAYRGIQEKMNTGLSGIGDTIAGSQIPEGG